MNWPDRVRSISLLIWIADGNLSVTRKKVFNEFVIPVFFPVVRFYHLVGFFFFFWFIF